LLHRSCLQVRRSSEQLADQVSPTVGAQALLGHLARAQKISEALRLRILSAGVEQVQPVDAPVLLSTPTATGGGGLPSAALVVTDPARTGAVFQYNEPWRRLCEASRMLKGATSCWSRANGAH
jgi:hypothetical protein